MVHELGGTVRAEAGSVSRGQGLGGLCCLDRLSLVRQIHLQQTHQSRSPLKLESRHKRIADGDCEAGDVHVVEFNIMVDDIIVRFRPDEGMAPEVVTQVSSDVSGEMVAALVVCASGQNGPIKREALTRQARAFDARFAVGRPARTITGLVLAATRGIRSTREGCAPPACTIGLQRSASLVHAGRRIPTGIRYEILEATL